MGTCFRRSSSTTRRASGASTRSSDARSTWRRAIGGRRAGSPARPRIISCCWPRRPRGITTSSSSSPPVHGGVLLQAADRQGAARRACGRAHRAQQLSQGGSCHRHPDREAAAGHRRGGGLPRHPRAGQFLPGNAVPGDRRSAHRQHRPAADREGPGASARRDQRRPLSEAVGPQAARRAAVHRDGQVGERCRAPALPRGPVLPEDRRRDGAGLRRLSGGAREHGAHRGPLPRGSVRHRPQAAEFRRARRLHARRGTSSTSSGRGSRPGCRASGNWRAAR